MPDWLKGPITRDEAEGSLQPYSDGKFVVRVRPEGGHVLCVVYRGKPTHHLIAAGDDGTLKVNKKAYGSNTSDIEELITHLAAAKPGSGWPVPLKMDGSSGGTTESKPISRNGTGSQGSKAPKWLHPGMEKTDADRLLGIGGLKDGRFIVRKRGTQYPKDYVLSVVFRGKPTHHLITPREDGLMTINKKSYGDNIRTMKQLIMSFVYEDLPAGWPVQLTEYVTREEEVVPVKLRNTKSQRSNSGSNDAGSNNTPPTSTNTESSTSGGTSADDDAKAWLHPTMTNDEAKDLINGHDDGFFLIRPYTGENQYVVSVMYRGKPTHHLINAPSDSVATVNKKPTGVQGIINTVKLLRSKQPFWPVPLTSFAAPKAAEEEAPAAVPADSNDEVQKAEKEAAEKVAAEKAAAEKAAADQAAAESQAQKKREEEVEKKRIADEEEKKQASKQQQQQQAADASAATAKEEEPTVKQGTADEQKRQQDESRKKEEEHQQAEDKKRQEAMQQQQADEKRQKEEEAERARLAAEEAERKRQLVEEDENAITGFFELDDPFPVGEEEDNDNGYLFVHPDATTIVQAARDLARRSSHGGTASPDALMRYSVGKILRLDSVGESTTEDMGNGPIRRQSSTTHGGVQTQQSQRVETLEKQVQALTAREGEYVTRIAKLEELTEKLVDGLSLGPETTALRQKCADLEKKFAVMEHLLFAQGEANGVDTHAMLEVRVIQRAAFGPRVGAPKIADLARARLVGKTRVLRGSTFDMVRKSITDDFDDNHVPSSFKFYQVADGTDALLVVHEKQEAKLPVEDAVVYLYDTGTSNDNRVGGVKVKERADQSWVKSQ